ncbi:MULTISPECIES: acyl-CoA dehydrogenase family protein [unclassified Arthrobacter]|uniref:acyl-CoA dehydrogenase family protein n=1 Tax=unclassified Arthrobacter TaxID=235627 RepID=UPI001E35679F|nr:MULTISPECIES: acyl-CoA dehydrogenase family protein [unclassified Arthrobacter]MCC9144891.1 acyl-CoA/acyl-ACP dehydrogenase [Arthrobacter sp. zg-Y919]MDK1276117.1 acyl-CoA dehydrogenase family protein [Arthrobacter sp. zg.Y919]WIB02542.1 acyl-CoA dehydrogenase family protein [Arthrobacter sp. zg-Y919]
MTATAMSADGRGSSIPEPEYRALLAAVTAWVEGPGEDWATRIEATGCVPDALWKELRGAGFLSLAAPEVLGGRGLSFLQWMGLMEVFSRSHASIRMIVHVVNGTWRAMNPYADEVQREKFVRPSVTGDVVVAFTLTEPDNGTGADITSSVRREGAIYYLTGRKHLITFGVRCDYWLLFARLAGTTGSDGTVALLVDRHAPGIEVEDTSQTMGVRGTDHASLAFTETPVPVTNRLGAEGDGLAVALGGFLTPSRISVAMSCVGLAQRAQQLAVAYALERTTFGKPLATRQAVAFALAENAADIEAARALTLHAASAWQDGTADAGALSSMAKLTAVDMLTRVTDKALQVHGGIGYWKTTPIERVYRDARAQRFEEGTNEIQKTVIARSIFNQARLQPPPSGDGLISRPAAAPAARP